MAYVTSPDPEAEWWTTSEVAEYLGVQVGTVSSYRNRGQMPEPDKTLGRTHLWRPQTITSWHEGRPRLGSRAADVSNGQPWTVLQVSTAVETRDAAVELARLVVEARLAAGAQIVGPVISAFWHQGEFGTGEEWQLLLKTHAQRFEDLRAFLQDHHPWQNPEIAAVPVVMSSDEYAAWVGRTLLLDVEP
ncbi:Uncharacterized protein involved in tolerance to divalent cations [Micromonospora sediminicola]|uniref:Uncharacterized protein involved in tolerance to divalent cations n=1 Tax=Micromonospora sediminicola TaxID=946078 RepID=A0A1A9BDM6_9ACTN|nr:Uncharacterized protein involved in tolerance to divalent cations [Micromonospora sediminicola]SBT67289.1 Uncharacterized protein involved in tolerance to divalent cations [Micromonospora sediminicola]